MGRGSELVCTQNASADLARAISGQRHKGRALSPFGPVCGISPAAEMRTTNATQAAAEAATNETDHHNCDRDEHGGCPLCQSSPT
jgi:hypothetical protein